MLYRENEKGRYEGVTDKGQVVQFDDVAEIVAAAKLRRELNVLVGRSEPMELDDSVRDLFLPKEERSEEGFNIKTVKFRIHKGEYVVDGLRLKKKKALA